MQVEAHVIKKYSPHGCIHKPGIKEATYSYNPVSSDIGHAQVDNEGSIECEGEARQFPETMQGDSPILM